MGRLITTGGQPERAIAIIEIVKVLEHSGRPVMLLYELKL